MYLVENSHGLPAYWFYAAAFAVSGIGWAIREVRARSAQSWPTVDGIVEFTHVRVEGRAGSESREIPEVAYSYHVEGEYYGGYHRVTSEPDLADFPKGSRVVVHYKQSDPSTSFLDREDLGSRKARIASGLQR